MMTPLLFCVNRGYMEIVRQLIDMGADRNCSDKNVSYVCSNFVFHSILGIFFSFSFPFLKCVFVPSVDVAGANGAVLRSTERQRDNREDLPQVDALQRA